MSKIIILLLSVILLSSFASADIIINKQPENLYNLGDVIDIPVKIVASKDIKKSFSMNLLCDGIETEVYKLDLKLSSGEEKSLSPIIILDKTRIEKSTGTCKIKAILGEEYKLTNEFIGSLIAEIRYRYNLDLDLIGFYKKFKDHKILGDIIKKWKGMRPGHPSSLYEYLIIGIVAV